MAFQCSEITKELTVKGKKEEDIFSENIKLETVETLMKIAEIRKLHLNIKERHGVHSVIIQ